MIAFRNGIPLIQNGIQGPVDLFAVVDVYTAILVDEDPQLPLAAFPDIFHIPQLAAEAFHHGLCKGGDLIGYFQKNTFFQRKREGRAPLFRIFYARLPVL